LEILGLCNYSSPWSFPCIFKSQSSTRSSKDYFRIFSHILKGPFL